MSAGPGDVLRRAGAWAVRRTIVTRALTTTPRARGRGLALLWHRISPEEPRPTDVVPTVTSDRFREQLEVLGELGDVVPLADLERPGEGGRPRFALTFDDDDPRHVDHALPVLRQLGMPATFFLSGRFTAGLGPYWWELLERQLATRGVQAVADELGVPAGDPESVAAAVERRAEARMLLEERTDPTGLATFTAEHVQRLRSAGMEIGFHTLRHPLLPLVPVDRLEDEVRDGRASLETVVGAPLHRFAYPHGGVDAAVARHVAADGYVSAWTSSQHPADPHGDPHRQGRWEPRDRPADALVRGVLRRLHLPGGGS